MALNDTANTIDTTSEHPSSIEQILQRNASWNNVNASTHIFMSKKQTVRDEKGRRRELQQEWRSEKALSSDDMEVQWELPLRFNAGKCVKDFGLVVKGHEEDKEEAMRLQYQQKKKKAEEKKAAESAQGMFQVLCGEACGEAPSDPFSKY